MSAMPLVVPPFPAAQDAAAARLCHAHLLGQIIEAVLLIDPAERTVVYANPQAERLFRAGAGGLPGRSLDALLDPADPAGEAALRPPRRDSDWRGELQLRRCDGSRARVHADSIALQVEGRNLVQVVLQDRSAQRQIDNERRLLWSSMDHLSEVLIVFDRHLDQPGGPRITFVNRAFSDIFERPLESTIGEPLSALLPTAAYREGIEALYARLRAGECAEVRWQIPRPCGMHWLDMRAMPVRDEHGRVRNHLAIGTNVTAEQDALDELREQQRWYQRIFDQSPDAVAIIAPDGNVVFANRQAERTLAPRLAGVVGRHYRELILPDNRLPVENYFERALAGETLHWEDSVRGRRDLRHLSITLSPLTGSSGLKGLTCIWRDITALRTAEMQLQLAGHALESIAEAAAITNGQMRFILINKAFTEITGYTAADVLGKLPSTIMTGDVNETNRAILHGLGESGRWSGEIWQQRGDGTHFPALMTVSRIDDPQLAEPHYVAVFNDISDYKAYEARLQHMAHHDSLTQLANRVAFHNALQRALARSQRIGGQLAVLLIDLDQFKAINDSLGHGVGDDMLKAVAQSLLRTVRASDTVARLGGDEFAILLEDLDDASQAARVAEQLLAVCDRPVQVEGYELYSTVSIGVVCAPDDGDDVETLLKRADAAMYQAKTAGRNTYRFFSAQSNARANRYLALANGLRRAVEQGDFALHYQPLIQLGTGRVTGVEALVRWQHPELGPVPPSDFIPVAEATGVIGALGEWVLRTACRQARAWDAAGHPPLRMAVNLSARQFRDPHLVDTILAILAESGLAPARLELEITESMMMENPESVKQALGALREHRVTIAIDDFGTGFSSLSYLKTFPLDHLKIDRSFVAGLPDDAGDAAITQTIIAIAKRLGLAIIAEGVETGAQQQCLQAEGCDEGQGYWFSKPMPADELEALLRLTPTELPWRLSA
ncbi:MAG TPA: EAL domain-containing protein [Gammaproteobacteria bacterium]|nr:EAL domain-containing protein [Gammaproteobacteria bacterium]